MPAADALVELDVEVAPRWAFRLQSHGGRDGVLRARDGVLERLLHVEGAPVWISVRQLRRDLVVFVARSRSRDAAGEGIARMRFALGVDDDLRPFYERFRTDPLIGASLRREPWLRPARRPDPFEALAWAICEQLIESDRAAAIERRIVISFGRRCRCCGLRDLPSPPALAALAPAELCAVDLAAGRALALIRAAREVARGRVDVDPAGDHERAWRRLRTIRGIGSWTIDSLAQAGQGHHDVVPAGDLAYRKLVGRLQTGDPRARVEEAEVREYFSRYDPWAGMAALHALRAAFTRAARGLPLAA
ncbi:MAG: hypothetical protein DLM63_05675 [Solirubrobacterales bacterium]|nr:MAG: hypothetical protein DLM63_05675 [Solirubrobacterales bacterium]